MTDRLRDAVEAVLVAMLPGVIARTLGTLVKWEYKVVSVTPGPPVKISGTPVGSSPYGDLADIVLWPGPSGGYAVPPVDSLILVEFHDGTPSKPAVAGLDPSTPPTLTTLGGGSTPIALAPLFIDTFLTACAGAVAAATPGPVAAAALAAAVKAWATTVSWSPTGGSTTGSQKVVSG